jgi:hypothetical protein
VKFLIRQRPTPTSSSPEALTVSPLKFRIPHRPMRVLDFDIENRPLSYLGSDFTTAEVTAIAWAWTDTPEDVTVYLLGEHPLDYILKRFVAAYNQADVVTGHYIRGHDLPMLNGALMECRMAPLADKMVCDTKIDMMRCKGLSLSQESLGAMFRLEYAKEQMNQIKWRSANRLTPEGLAEVRRRVVGDVRQHIGLRQELIAGGYLGPSTMWRSGSAKAETYVP